ncbi:HNH endonuclease signature motif containing protein [Rhodococcus triatomae]|uniref:HNH endonuclease signature motif containing protein n=2 Tax=Rhodococcus triatomae TaxID=300028 RepID=UPI0020C84AFE|nr:HNH endonuclease signature motif containing protein [Rhodococcus triatomae]
MSAKIAAFEAQRVAVVAEVERRCTRVDHGYASTKGWLSSVTVVSPGAAGRIVELGAGLAEHPAVAEAFDEGRIAFEHALLIVRFCTKPPKGMPAEALPGCVAALLAAADGPLARTDGVRTAIAKLEAIFESDDQPTSEDTDRNELYVSKTLNGRVAIRGDVDAVTGEMLLTALSKYSAPQPASEGTPDARAPRQRRADGLTQLLSMLLAFGELGVEGGERPHLSVHVHARDLGQDRREEYARRHAGAGATANTRPPQDPHHPDSANGSDSTDSSDDTDDTDDLTDLADRRGIAWSPWMGPLTINTARLLGCDANVTAIILDEHGAPLSVGRTHRTVTRAQRKALAARDGGCAFPGCGATAAWCEGHHITHWADGGPTDLDKLVLLCGTHHRLLHTTDWEVTIGKTRHPVFTPPTSVDPAREPVPSRQRVGTCTRTRVADRHPPRRSTVRRSNVSGEKDSADDAAPVH